MPKDAKECQLAFLDERLQILDFRTEGCQKWPTPHTPRIPRGSAHGGNGNVPKLPGSPKSTMLRSRAYQTATSHRRCRMAFRDFTFPSVIGKFGLNYAPNDLATDAVPLAVRPEFATFFEEGLAIAVGDLGICTEKAKSEFIVAPILTELRRIMDRRFCVFSGMELNVNKGRGLNGACDFILTRGGNQHLREAPIVGIFEAKNVDFSRQGLGQCIAAMVAAQMRNRKAGWSVTSVFGARTTGRAWQFLLLEGTALNFDSETYRIHSNTPNSTDGTASLGRVMGILKHRIECSSNPAPAALNSHSV